MATHAAKSASNAELRSLAAELGLPFVEAADAVADPELFSILPVEAAVRHLVLPLALIDGKLKIAVSDPLDLSLEQKLSLLTRHALQLAVAEPETIRGALRQAETSRRMLDSVSGDFVSQDSVAASGAVNVDVAALQEQSGVVKLANSILIGAIQRTASDIHIEVYPERVDLKFRVDGVLYPATSPLDVRHHAELVSRFKVIADLDIAERRMPQDGRFRLKIENRHVDFRVSVLPTQFGEDLVIRILDKGGLGLLDHSLSLSDLGLEDGAVESIRRAVRAPHGLVLMTGPTGSGKTTTLYGAISELATGQEKLITIEDPIEYLLDGIVQVAVNEKRGMSFASGLRSILRHDPDRIMVGEIRDFETATIAVQAALTGHLVLASVHANSSFDVISRFAHWGIDLHDFVAALNGVFAQRLLRKLCADCARRSARETASSRWREAVGCPHCFGTGYRGRTAIFEHLAVTPAIAELMIARAPSAALRQAAEAEGMRLLREAVMEKARAGITTLDEVDRVTFAA